jgi:Cu(I)/Ag(I) efflux system membrane fusion protein
METKSRSARKTVLQGLAAIVGIALIVLLGIAAFTWRLPFIGAKSEATAPDGPGSSKEEADVAYWTCVMHPSVHNAAPGSCPVCNMDLVPVKKGAGLTLTQSQKDLIPIRTESVGFHVLEKEIRSVGTLEYNERKLAYVSPRVSGWIEQVFVDFTGTSVRENDHLVRLFSRELLPAQQEYLGNLEYLAKVGDGDATARTQAEEDVAAAEDKLILLGLTKEQVADIKERGKVQSQLVLYAPIGGTVVETNAVKGRQVKEGENLYKIADLSSLWMIADIYEYEIPWVRRGQAVAIACDAWPGKTFNGKVWFIYPYLRTETRTQKILVEVPNAEGRLKPGMFVTARLKASLRDIYSPAVRKPYACPMHPWIEADEPGTCSLCGMNLEETIRPASEQQPVSETFWTCPMHPQIRQDGPGNCPICRMQLVEKKGGQPRTKTVLTCGMPGHPQFEPGSEPENGRCPVCEMKLIEKTVSSPEDEGELTPQFRYVCPDHPNESATQPGKCSLDGKELVMTDDVLAVPKSAVIDTGRRTVVYVDKGEGGYVAADVVLGPESWAIENGVRQRFLPILKGLNPGETVVTNGNFLIDSQSELTGSAAGAYGGAIGKEQTSEPSPAQSR